MPPTQMSRRDVVEGTGALALASWLASLVSPAAAAGAPEAGVAFEPGEVLARAEALAAADFVKPSLTPPAPFDQLNGPLYKEIRLRPEATVWRGARIDHEVEPLPFGWIYNTPVELWVVDQGLASPLVASSRSFSFGASLEKVPEEAPFGFSGMRLLAPINRADQMEAYAIFQGASYFRALGRGQGFGMSARGLAVNTAQPSGEEFPFFRAFWIEKPRASAQPLTIHALLDSPSVAGAYSFVIMPGESTAIDVSATLFPRRQLTHVGIAPLTSMYLLGAASHRVDGGVRPQVHDSDGLAILNGRGERLWRPLTNPATLQTSAFMDTDPKGFGLAQRDRAFSSFEDLEARFERRPTAWVEPKGGWGAGYVELIEIPAAEQIHDNIVTYWKPAKPLEPGMAHPIAYRLTWGHDVPVAWAGARVRKTRTGKIKRESGENRLFVVDFDGPALKDLVELPRAELAASAGTIANVAVARHPEIDGVRVSFELAVGESETIELRLSLKQADQLISESWLFRWTNA